MRNYKSRENALVYRLDKKLGLDDNNNLEEKKEAVKRHSSGKVIVRKEAIMSRTYREDKTKKSNRDNRRFNRELKRMDEIVDVNFKQENLEAIDIVENLFEEEKKAA